MTAPRLWVWIGSTDDDKLDVMRYVRATDMDILRQPVVQREIDTLRATLDLSRSEAGSLGLDLDTATKEQTKVEHEIAALQATLGQALDDAREQEAAKEAAYQKIYKLQECNESMREPVKRLRELLEMPAEGEGAIIDAAVQSLMFGRDGIQELELLQDDIAEHLPRYVLDDGTDEPANARETVEYAGDELKRLAAENARLREVVDAVRAECAKFSFPDEDRPGLWTALSRLDSRHGSDKEKTHG